MDRVFLHLPGDEGSRLVNLLHVVQISDVTDDQLILHLSDGNTIILRGPEVVDHIIKLVSDFALTIEGRPMRMQIDDSKKTA